MTRKHPLTTRKDTDLIVGLCPVCNKRLTAECEHRTEQTESWLAAHIAAETNTDISDDDATRLHNILVTLAADPLVASYAELVNMAYMDAWQRDAVSSHADWLDWIRTQEDNRF